MNSCSFVYWGWDDLQKSIAILNPACLGIRLIVCYVIQLTYRGTGVLLMNSYCSTACTGNVFALMQGLDGPKGKDGAQGEPVS